MLRIAIVLLLLCSGCAAGPQIYAVKVCYDDVSLEVQVK